MSEASTTVSTAMSQSKKLEGDGSKVERHSLKEQIEAANFVDANTAMDKPARGIRFTKLKRPGTV